MGSFLGESLGLIVIEFLGLLRLFSTIAGKESSQGMSVWQSSQGMSVWRRLSLGPSSIDLEEAVDVHSEKMSKMAFEVYGTTSPFAEAEWCFLHCDLELSSFLDDLDIGDDLSCAVLESSLPLRLLCLVGVPIAELEARMT